VSYICGGGIGRRLWQLKIHTVLERVSCKVKILTHKLYFKGDEFMESQKLKYIIGGILLFILFVVLAILSL